MPTADQFQPNDAYNLTATIASGQTESAAVDMGGADLVGLFIPSTFDGTTLKIKGAPAADGTYVEAQDGSGVDFTLTVAAGKYVAIPNLAIIAGLRYIKLLAGTSQSSTDSVITLALRPV